MLEYHPVFHPCARRAKVFLSCSFCSISFFPLSFSTRTPRPAFQILHVATVRNTTAPQRYSKFAFIPSYTAETELQTAIREEKW
jgi:hypothetical protein